jgi:RNA polymerase sigma factor (sigma-70 family)
MASQTATLLRHAIRSAGDSSAVSDRDLLRRFAEAGDQAAFAALVRRHSGMVLGVCRRALPQLQDAEDACQATFLVLTRKAKSIRWQPSVANWLYATARRVAHNAGVAAKRRARREGRAAVPEAIPPVDRMSGRELLATLDRELDRLPPIYREPLVLCYLEGLTHDEAAARLGVAAATLKVRIHRGRKRLHAALTRGGAALGAGLLALAATSPAGASPPRLCESILAAAAGHPPAAVAALAEGVAMNGLTNRTILSALFIAGAVALGLGVGADRRTSANPILDDNKRPVRIAGETEKRPESYAYSGRVLDPNGKPVAGAKLYVTHAGGYFKEAKPSPEFARTGPDGQYEFAVEKKRFDEWGTVVAAAAPGFGVGWAQLKTGGSREGVTIHLVKDDVPITGQIVDLQGRPIPGATLTVLQINAAPDENLGPWLVAAKKDKGLALELEQKHLNRFTFAVSPKVTTDAEGRFTLTGIGRERLVRAQLDGPTIASQPIRILTRPGTPIDVTYHRGNQEYGEPRIVSTYYGANFRHAAAPCQPIIGVVRDRDTKAPLAGVTVRGYTQIIAPGASRGLDIVVKATTDAEGRYRLIGMPKGKGYSVAALPHRDQPYLPVHAGVPDNTGLDPVSVDLELKRGVWIEGRITDKATGKPVKGAVEYFSLYTNPNLTDYPGYDGTFLMDSIGRAANEDGSFRVVGLPGPGLLGVYYQRPPYLRANERTDEFGTTKSSFQTAPYHLSFTSNYNALARVDPPKGSETVHCDVTVEPRSKK